MSVRPMHFEQIPISEVKKIMEPTQRKEQGMNDGEMKYPEWQHSLLDAIMEFDPEILAWKIEQMEILIQARREELRERANGSDEERALQDALASLRVLKRDRLDRKGAHGDSAARGQ